MKKFNIFLRNNKSLIIHNVSAKYRYFILKYYLYFLMMAVMAVMAVAVAVPVRVAVVVAAAVAVVALMVGLVVLCLRTLVGFRQRMFPVSKLPTRKI